MEKKIGMLAKTLKVVLVFLSVLVLGCDDEKASSITNVPETKIHNPSKVTNAQLHVTRNSPPKKKSYSLMHIDLGMEIDYTNDSQIESLGVYDAREDKSEDVLFFKPKKPFREFNEYFIKVNSKTRRVSQVFAVSHQSSDTYTTEQAKGEVNYIISLLKQKYGVPEDRHVSSDHLGNSPLFDKWVYTVEIDQRYKFSVSRAFSTASGWTLTIQLIDTVPDMDKADIEAL